MFRYILLFLAGIISCTIAAGNAAGKNYNLENQYDAVLPDSITLDELVVTGSKLETSTKLVPFAVTQITESTIQQSGHHNILSAVNAHVPGLFVTERNILGFGVAVGGSGAINIRGIGSAPNTQVLVLIDGHPQYQGIFGHPLPDAYVASDVEKVEVIRGPASVLYGSNAMGGAINIITKKAVAEGWSGQLTAAYGSYDTRKYAVTTALKKDKLNAFMAINHGSTDGIRENTDFEISNGYAKIGYDISTHWKVNTDLSVAQYQANDNGPLHAPALFSIDILRGKAAISAENQYEHFEGAVKAYHNFGTHVLSDGWESSDRNSGLMVYQTYRMGTATRITAGLEAKQYGGMGNKGFSANQLKLVNELAAYALVRHQLWEILDVTAGLRREHHSVFGSEWVPMGGVTARVTTLTTFKGIVSKGFRSPTVMELYTYAPNPELVPERVMNYEMSWMQSWLNARLNTEMTVFIAEGENMIQVVGVGPAAKRQNVGSFNHKGVELSARYELSQSWNMSANYSYLQMEVPVLAAPKHQLNMHIGYQYRAFSANVSAQQVSGLYTVLPRQNVAARQQQYLLLNARAALKVRPKLELFLSGQNLLDTQYEVNYGYLMPGINVHGGVKLGW